VSVVTANKLGVAGAQALAKALESNTTLTTLILDSACATAVPVSQHVDYFFICCLHSPLVL
jgi:hypothetical protein